MKDGTRYASAFKKAYSKWHQSLDTIEVPEADDPLRRLAIATLGVEGGDDAAARSVDRIFETLVDWNDVRVSRADELERLAGDGTPGGRERCGRLIAALQSVYEKENKLSLDRLKSIGRREVKQYLESLRGVDEYAVASVLLWSFGGHAVPVCDHAMIALRAAGVVHPEATRAEVQAFLERHVSANAARETCLVLERLARSNRSSPKRAASGTPRPRERKRTGK